jgi:serine protease Do
VPLKNIADASIIQDISGNHRQNRMRSAILLILLALLALAIGTREWRAAGSDETNSAAMLPSLQEYEKELAAICDSARESIVQVETDYPPKYYDETGREVAAGDAAVKVVVPPPRKISSGFFVTDSGHIVTLISNVEGAQKITVRPSTSDIAYEAQIVGTDIQTGIAVLKIEGNVFKPVKFGKSSDLRQGHLVAAAGNPFGLLRATMSFGTVSGLNRTIQTEAGQFAGLFQYTAQVYPGDSGGLVLNSRGEAVGIIFATYQPEDAKRKEQLNEAMTTLDELLALTDPQRGGKMTNDDFVKELRTRLAALAERQKQVVMSMRFSEGAMSPYEAVSSTGSLHFAIPADLVKYVIDQLVASGKVVRAVLGVRIGEIGDEIRGLLGLEKGEGLLVEQVLQNGPAAGAGVQGNDIILSVDDRPVGSLLDMKVLMGAYKPGDKIKLALRRNKERMTVEVTLGASQ